jgi:hypothetical protein
MSEPEPEISTVNYQLQLDKRRELLSLADFWLDEYRVWRHSDGRAVGEGVIVALVDSAFLRYIGLAETLKKGQSTGV